MVDDNHKNSIGRHLFSSFGLAVIQQQSKKDEVTIPGRSYLSEEQWADTGLCSNLEVQKVICTGNFKAHAQQEKMQDSKNRLMWSEEISRPISRTELSVQFKIARKIHANRREKRNVDGLYELLEPGSTVNKVDHTTSKIKEPSAPEITLECSRVKKSDIAKFGTNQEGSFELAQYSVGQPPKTTKTLKHKKIKITRKNC